MKWCRFQIEQRVSYGVVEDDRVTEVSGSPLAEHTVTNTYHLLSEVKLLPPIIPPMLYAAGPNYRGHVKGMAKRRGAEPKYPDRPEPNFRSVHALIGTEENIVVPKDCSGAVQPEGQLAVVIGKKGRRLICEGDNRQVTRLESDGAYTPLAQRLGDKRINRPNDIVTRSDGIIYFTDPAGRLPQAERELDFSGVHQIAPEKLARINACPRFVSDAQWVEPEAA